MALEKKLHPIYFSTEFRFYTLQFVPTNKDDKARTSISESDEFEATGPLVNEDGSNSCDNNGTVTSNGQSNGRAIDNKKKREYKKRYTEENLQEAIAAINNGCSIYKVSKYYNIPATTLRDKRSRRYCSDAPGRKTILTKEEEGDIVDWINYLGKHGFIVTRDQLRRGVTKVVENLNRPTPFKDGIPGKHWLSSFISRHSTVANIMAQTVPMKITEDDLRIWFDTIKSFFTNDLLEVLEEGCRVYSCEEIGFYLNPKDEEVVLKKQSRHMDSNVDKDCLSILVNVSAGGVIAPSMVLYPYKRVVPEDLLRNIPSTWSAGHTESGWMNEDTFYDYITNVFYKWLLENEIKMPVVVFMDQTSQISLELSRFCKEKGILLVALPTQTELQPLNSVFRHIETMWKNIVEEFKLRNKVAKLARADFGNEVQKCFEKCLKADTIKDSFKNAGLFPFDVKNIDLTKVSTSTEQTFVEQFEKRLSSTLLDLFLKSGSEWEGEEQYRGLFEFWRKIRQEVTQL
ncbi:uncharacterized protein [Epargyreus clarus]|uniref:uncharacterized protein isoform X2 n=1 Tax=Epargyreus clarus TaxID=520877 RepID=UPI003C2FBB9C